MRRRRKVPIADEEKENEAEKSQEATTTSDSIMLHGPMYTIMSNVQLNETFHKKYIKELKQLYAKMDHDAFVFTFIKMMKSAMEGDESNEYANTTLLFCAKFISAFDGDETHPLVVQIFQWLLTTISNNPHIRFRLCEFVNMILTALGTEAALDDAICDRIMEYMLDRLRDIAPSVRVQAILAMQRLQVPDNPDDPVLRAYQFHLCSDPSPRVRQAVITCMGRNNHTIPYILDRLWDIDEKVRRHTYLHMSSYPVGAYKVSQRLTLLEQGLNDRSDAVRKVVTTIMLQQWIESHRKNFVFLVRGLKLDASDEEMERFRKITKQALKEIFKRQQKQDLLACLPIEEDGEFHRCVPHELLTVEIAFYWQCLVEYLQIEMAEELDLIVPELSAFCAYIESFCQSKTGDMEKFEHMEFQYTLLSLMEILYTFDLGDEIGRGNLQKLLMDLLQKYNIDQKVIEMTIKCAENLITDQSIRLQHFVEIIKDICNLNQKPDDLLHDRALIEELLANSSDPELKLKLSSLKVKILDLEEQQSNYQKSNDYEKAQQISELRAATTDEYINLLKPLLEQHSNAHSLQLTKVVKNETILKSLQIAYYMVVSRRVSSLNPSVCGLYKDFICRYIASSQIAIRDWALKCASAYSLIYEPFAKSVFVELYKQFHKNHNIRIWETSITCIFELLDRYGLDNFAVQEDHNKTKRSGRQLYNTLEFLDVEDDSQVAMEGPDVSIIYTMSHLLDKCQDVCITSAIITGFCRLVLRGYIKKSDIIEKLLLCYFNPTTDAKINQILGVFLENLIQRKQHALLQPCLLPTVATVFSAPYDSPLHEIRPDTITRFFINATRQETCQTNGCLHNKLALTFLQEMCNNVNNKELAKLLAKDLITLELNVTQNEELKQEMKTLADTLIKSDFESRTIRYIIDFKDMIDGKFNPPAAKTGEEIYSDDEDKSDDDTATISSTKNTAKIAKLSEELESIKETETEENTNSDDLLAPATTTNISTAAISTPPTTPTTAATEAVETTTISNEANHSITAATEETTVTDSNDAEQNSTNQTATETTLTNATASANKTISPSSAPTPTTYGRENRVIHRYLRKSLNISRSQSDNDDNVDGPSRPPKIRIEARIDSDKKTPQLEKQTTSAINARARRNLRYGKKRTCATEENKQISNTKSRINESDTDDSSSTSSSAATSAEEEKDEPKEPTRKKDSTKVKAAQCPTDNIKEKPLQKKTTRAAAIKLRTNTLRNKTKEPATNLKAAQTNDNDELNSSCEVIEASPSKDTPEIRTTRLRRALVSNSILQTNRNRTATTTTTTTTPATSKTTGVVEQASKSQLELTKSKASANVLTPKRNGRKRILRKSPTKSDDDDNLSTPQPKHLRTDAANVQWNSRTAQAKTAVAKENALALSKSSSKSKNASSDSEDDDDDDDNMPLLSRRRRIMPVNREVAVAQRKSESNQPSKVAGSVELSSSAIRTRNLASKERQKNNIMTRRRLSLEHKNANKHASSPNAKTLQQKRKNAATTASRIPVRTTKSTTKSLTASTSPPPGRTNIPVKLRRRKPI